MQFMTFDVFFVTLLKLFYYNLLNYEQTLTANTFSFKKYQLREHKNIFLLFAKKDTLVKVKVWFTSKRMAPLIQEKNVIICLSDIPIKATLNFQKSFCQG